ncbi:MarR family winged helix-turn-helix transcriptional regulator [Curtobacterium sp. TXMA1]|uniref:MarR family winged helix-turn-helix transcriptional regulator n=1 Tax=Curtobacterium sp. TXMA1 TaxID=2876939 RepID=UPI001CCB8EAB|nr:MarR family winged helix-turn-helix transcriptional regulator [Curtobacterium sp. TXMA1]UBQ02963.1 MarR family winged helix-turn-helix transcriptional regulator [Curtobacterium sp. TXMA1]
MDDQRNVERELLERELTSAQQRLFSESQQVAHAFARQHGMTERDFSAILAIMLGEVTGEALTPTALAKRIRLSSPATTSVINKLVAAGHAERHRDSEDLRRVTLRYGPAAREVAGAFFAPLAEASRAHADQFSTTELRTVARWLTGMADIMGSRAAELD